MVGSAYTLCLSSTHIILEGKGKEYCCYATAIIIFPFNLFLSCHVWEQLSMWAQKNITQHCTAHYFPFQLYFCEKDSRWDIILNIKIRNSFHTFLMPRWDGNAGLFFLKTDDDIILAEICWVGVICSGASIKSSSCFLRNSWVGLLRYTCPFCEINVKV